MQPPRQRTNCTARKLCSDNATVPVFAWFILKIRPVLSPHIDVMALGFVDCPIESKKVASAKLSVNVVAWISVPNEAHDLYKELTTFPEARVACLQQDECSAAQTRVLRGKHTIDVSSGYSSVLDHA